MKTRAWRWVFSLLLLFVFACIVQAIPALPSLQELRLEDYLANRKGSAAGGLGTGLFNTGQTGTTLLGAGGAGSSVFGQTGQGIGGALQAKFVTLMTKIVAIYTCSMVL